MKTSSERGLNIRSCHNDRILFFTLKTLHPWGGSNLITSSARTMKTYSTYYSGIIQTTRQNQAKIDMNNIYLPLHVWDREFDSRLAVAYLEACKGNRSIIGHEYNIAPCYKHDHNALLELDNLLIILSGNWHKEIKDRGGIVITHDEEGINNMPFDFVKVGQDKTATLNLDKINEFPHKGSPQAFKNVSMQIAWGDLHRAFQCHQISNIESRSIAINRIVSKSSVRFDF